MSQKQNVIPSAGGVAGLIVLIIIAAIAGQFVASAVLPEPVIVLVDIAGFIDPDLQMNYQARFDYIDTHPEVAGVVLLIESPGGECSLSEDLYYQFARLRERMPVVASITRIGASGAYYAAMGSNYVMTKPGSYVGSVGVVSEIKAPEAPDDANLTSGPFKANGYAVSQFVRDLDKVKEYFAGVVYAERMIAWERWHAGKGPFPHTQDSLATGRTWTGAAAVAVGIADGFGSTTDAIELVAEIGGLRRYRVLHLDDAFMQSQGYTITVTEDDAEPTLQEVMDRVGDWPGYWYIYVPPVE